MFIYAYIYMYIYIEDTSRSCLFNISIMYICICLYMHTYICIYTSRTLRGHVFLVYQLCIYVYVYICIHIYVYIHRGHLEIMSFEYINFCLRRGPRATLTSWVLGFVAYDHDRSLLQNIVSFIGLSCKRDP